jgi:hypothetical protein
VSTTVANFDIAGAADRIVTFANELIASQWARQAEFNVHDRDRSTAYLDRLENYVGVISEPANPLDLPKMHPTAYAALCRRESRHCGRRMTTYEEAAG